MTMVTIELIERLPKVVSVLGEQWIQQNAAWIDAYIDPRLVWYEQLEQDLACLEARMGLQKLTSCYRDPLRDKPQIQKTMYEIHGAALLASMATRVDLHVPRGDGMGTNFDVWAEIEGQQVNAECKTRKDEFPFNLPRESGDIEEGVSSRWGVRETIDPHDAAELGIQATQRNSEMHHIQTPESTVIRQMLLDGLSQLPRSGCNIIIFGQIEGNRRSLEEALYGTEMFGIKKDLQTRKVTVEPIRAPTGAFTQRQAGEPFLPLSAVLWVCLFKSFDSPMFRAYKLYLNPCANTPVSKEVQKTIEKIAKAWERLPETENSSST